MIQSLSSLDTTQGRQDWFQETAYTPLERWDVEWCTWNPGYGRWKNKNHDAETASVLRISSVFFDYQEKPL